jgi:hypothetical protein
MVKNIVKKLIGLKEQILSFNNEKGVSLIMTFFIMMIILAVVLAISVLLYSELKVIRNISNSMISFYAADSGIEKVLYYDRQKAEGDARSGLCTICDSSDNIDCSYSGTDCETTTCTDCTASFHSIIDDKTYYIDAAVSVNEEQAEQTGTAHSLTVNSLGSYGSTSRKIQLQVGDYEGGVGLSAEAQITAFAISGQTGTVINETNHTVALTVPYGTSITSLAPAITISTGATIFPASGTSQNFTNPVTYTVTAEDGVTSVFYTATVTVASSTASCTGTLNCHAWDSNQTNCTGYGVNVCTYSSDSNLLSYSGNWSFINQGTCSVSYSDTWRFDNGGTIYQDCVVGDESNPSVVYYQSYTDRSNNRVVMAKVTFDNIGNNAIGERAGISIINDGSGGVNLVFYQDGTSSGALCLLSSRYGNGYVYDNCTSWPGDFPEAGDT